MISNFEMRIAEWKNQARIRSEHMTKQLCLRSFFLKVLKSTIRNFLLKRDRLRSKGSALIAQHPVLFFSLCAILFALGAAADGQQPSKLYRIGFLSTNPPEIHAWDALLEGLRERGYIEGRNIVFERRFSEGQAERFREFAAEMVRLKVDIVIVTTTPAALAAKSASQTIPIIIPTAIDPVGSGLVASLARPGGNITGLSALHPELSGKRLELIKEIVPGMIRVAVLWNPANSANATVWKETQAAARVLGLLLHSQEVRGPQDFEGALALTAKARPDAIFVFSDSLINMRRQQIADFVTQKHLPSVFASMEGVLAGGLMSYGPSLSDRYRRTAAFVDKILKGAKPAELPVEQPTRFEFVINLKAAKQIGLTIPPNVLVRADRVIR
jgi:putative ABC transport system substrate-binding protein